ncbi:MAG: hypothetical protein D6766_12530 [Verrucomicrobia bacterium]|nr:MAG: hypothetical protein D6766_12530 [Verrucomicrobiota bacterium]
MKAFPGIASALAACSLLAHGAEPGERSPAPIAETSPPLHETPANPAAPVDLDRLLDHLLARAAKALEEQRLFEATHAYRLKRVIEHRRADNSLRRREQKVIEHDPRRAEPGSADEGPGYREKDFPVDRRLLARYRIWVEGEEPVAGRPAWILGFEPVAPPLPAHGVKEQFLNRIAGKVWIDQADRVMSRLELRLTEPVPVIGGLVGAVLACQVLLERERTAEGFWYNAHLHWRLEGRRLIFRSVLVLDERRTRVRRVKPITHAAAGPPADANAPTAANPAR